MFGLEFEICFLEFFICPQLELFNKLLHIAKDTKLND